MNIFWIEPDQRGMATSLADIHLRKMILEYAQLLSTAHHVLDGQYLEVPAGIYKKTHQNHPCAKWVQSCSDNYNELYGVLRYCCEEFQHRFGKMHKTEELLTPLAIEPVYIPEKSKYEFAPLCMPDEFKMGTLLTSYRNYYNFKSSKMKMKWTNREEPEWFKQFR